MSFNYIYEQRSLTFPTRLECWLFQDGYKIAVNTNAGLTVHTGLGFADNNYCFKLDLLWIFNFFIVLMLQIDKQPGSFVQILSVHKCAGLHKFMQHCDVVYKPSKQFNI